MRNGSAVAAALCRYLEEERIEYCVLGDLQDIRAPACNRLELVVHGSALARMAPVLKAFCARNDAELVQYRRAAERVHVYTLGWLNRRQRPDFLSIGIRSDYLRCGQVLLTAQELLAGRLPVSGGVGQGRGYRAAAPAAEFICHLLRCIDRGTLSDRDGAHLSEQWRQDAPGVSTQVDRFWNSAREGGVVLRAAASGNWEPVHACVRALRDALRLRNVLPPTAWLSELLRKVGARIRPAGLMIACLGPDGSGKSSVIRALQEHPMHPFRDVHRMQLRPRLMRPGPVRQSPLCERKPHGRVGTAAKLLMFLADYWLGYWLQIRPKLVRSTLVVSDRYFDDMLVDPRRYRMARPQAFVRMLLPWIPRPKLWLVFDAPSDILRARQQDVPPEESARQRGEYRRVLRGRENVVVLDASQPLEKVIAQAERAIISQFAFRTARQLGLPVDTTSNSTATNILLFFCRRYVPVLSRLVRVLFNSDIQCHLPPDLHLPHPYGIVIHPQAVIGHRVTVMQQATIGGKDSSENIAPIIGDDVYVGAGARVLGDVRIGHGVVIGANAVVTRDIPPGATVVGANRIVTTTRGVTAGAPSPAPSVARFPIAAQRISRTQSR